MYLYLAAAVSIVVNLCSAKNSDAHIEIHLIQLFSASIATASIAVSAAFCSQLSISVLPLHQSLG